MNITLRHYQYLDHLAIQKRLCLTRGFRQPLILKVRYKLINGTCVFVSVLCYPILDSMAFLGGSVTANMGWYVISILHDQPSCNIEYYMDGRIDIMGQIYNTAFFCLITKFLGKTK